MICSILKHIQVILPSGVFSSVGSNSGLMDGGGACESKIGVAILRGSKLSPRPASVRLPVKKLINCEQFSDTKYTMNITGD